MLLELQAEARSLDLNGRVRFIGLANQTQRRVAGGNSKRNAPGARSFACAW